MRSDQSSRREGIHPKTCFNRLPMPLRGNGVVTFRQFMHLKEAFLSFSAAIQCLANTSELTEFFLWHHYRSIVLALFQNPPQPSRDPMIVSAWGIMINQMWNEAAPKLEPWVGGEVVAGVFQNVNLNFRQSDLYGQDVIGRFLRALSSSLQQIDGRDQGGVLPALELPDFAKNSAIISDLFQGEFKHVLSCQRCSQRTISKDPFMILPLPISKLRKTVVDFVYVPYSLNERNKIKVLRMKVSIEEDNIYTLREQIQKQHGIDLSSFLVSSYGSREMLRFYSCKTPVKQYFRENISTPFLLHEIPSHLVPKLPPSDLKDYGFMIPDEYGCVIFGFGRIPENELYPRVFFAKKSCTLLEFHRQFYEHMKDILQKWYKERGPVPEKADRLPDGPEFAELLSRNFELCLPQLNKFRPGIGAPSTLMIPYMLRIFRANSIQKLTPLLFSSNANFQKVINESITLRHSSQEEDQLSILSLQFDCLAEFSLKNYKYLREEEQARAEVHPDPEAKLTLEVSLRSKVNSYLKPELKYCQTCRDHTWNSKLRQINRLPPILIISFERNTVKCLPTLQVLMMVNSTYVDFPLEGLDMNGFVADKKDEENLLYDCYAVISADPRRAVSAALVKNPLDQTWRRFEGEQMTEIFPQELNQTVVTNSATTLFYRRRDQPKQNSNPINDFQHLHL